MISESQPALSLVPVAVRAVQGFLSSSIIVARLGLPLASQALGSFPSEPEVSLFSPGALFWPQWARALVAQHTGSGKQP